MNRLTLDVHPNPNPREFIINSNESGVKVSIKVFDAMGRALFSNQAILIAGENHFSLNEFANGVYSIRVQSASETIVTKAIYSK